MVALPAVDPDAEAADDGTGEVVALGEAIKRTLHEQMEEDERIRVFGEDVADAREAVLANVEGKGGVFGTTSGLQRRFGLARCYNTPLAEANIVGRAVGQGLRGLRPVPEVQFFDYIWPAMHQIKSEAATIRWRSNGAFTCPMVLRVPIGGYVTGGAIWHSQSGESIFTHIPGLTVVMPSRAADAVGLLRTALQAEDPILFLEHKHLLRQPYTRDPFPSRGFQIPFGRGRIAVEGDELTIVTWGALVEKSRQAAATLAAEDGSSVQVIDLRSLLPWDHELVATEVARTGRLLVVHEDVLTSGFGAEVAAWVGEHCFADLDAPVRRVAAADTHVAYEPTLAQAILPQVSDVVTAARDLPRVLRCPIRSAASSRWKKVAPVRLETVMVPDPGPGEALVAVRACGVCHTDLHYREGSINDDFPFLLGHEAAGTVEAVGEGVTNVAPGDYVVLAWRAPCGVCRSCRRGRPWYCFDSANAAQPMTLVGRDPAVAGARDRGLRGEDAGGRRPSRQGGPRGPARGGRLDRLRGHGRVRRRRQHRRGQPGRHGGGVRVRRSGRRRHCGGFPGRGSDDRGGGHRRPQAGVGPPFRRHTYGQRRRQPDVVEAIRDLTGGFGADVVIEAVGRPETYTPGLLRPGPGRHAGAGRGAGPRR